MLPNQREYIPYVGTTPKDILWNLGLPEPAGGDMDEISRQIVRWTAIAQTAAEAIEQERELPESLAPVLINLHYLYSSTFASTPSWQTLYEGAQTMGQIDRKLKSP